MKTLYYTIYLFLLFISCLNGIKLLDSIQYGAIHSSYRCNYKQELIFENFDISTVDVNQTNSIDLAVKALNGQLVVRLDLVVNITLPYISILVRDINGEAVEIISTSPYPCRLPDLTAKRNPITLSYFHRKSYIYKPLFSAMTFNVDMGIRYFGAWTSYIKGPISTGSLIEPYYNKGDIFLFTTLTIESTTNVSILQNLYEGVAKPFSFLNNFSQKPNDYQVSVLSSKIYSNYIEVDIIQNINNVIVINQCQFVDVCGAYFNLAPVSGTPTNGKYIAYKVGDPYILELYSAFSNQYYKIPFNATLTPDPPVPKQFTAFALTTAYLGLGIATFIISVENSQIIPPYYFKGLKTVKPVLNGLGEYPFRYLSGNPLKFSYFALQITGTGEQGSVTSLLTLSMQTKPDQAYDIGTITPDLVKPILQSIEFTKLPNMEVLVKAWVTDDLSGVMNIHFDLRLPNMTLCDLVYGDKNNATLEKVYSYSQIENITRFSVYDYAGNQDEYYSYYFGFTNNLNDFRFSNIEYMYFEHNNINLDKYGYGLNNTLYFKHNGSADQIPSFKLIHSSTISNDLSDGLIDYDFMKFDRECGCFKLDFFIPPNLFTGNLEYSMYIGGNEHTPTTLEGIIGSNATLSVKSSNADQLPPLISDLQYYNQLSSINIPNNQLKTKIGWIVEISETINGFRNGSFQIRSEMDYVGYTMDIDVCSSINQDPLVGTYEITFEIENQYCVNQTYYLYQVDLCDNYGYCSSTKETKYYNIMNPYKDTEMPLKTISLKCIDGKRETSLPSFAPNITINNQDQYSLPEIDVSSQEKDRTLAFQIHVEDPSGISDRHTPIIYLSSFEKTISFPFVCVGSGPRYRTFNSTFTIPYGFGYPHVIAWEIYGVVDNYLNFNSLTTGYIKTNMIKKEPMITNIKMNSTAYRSFYQIEVYGMNLPNVDIVIIRGDGSSYITHTETPNPVYFNAPVTKIIKPGDIIYFHGFRDSAYTVPPEPVQRNCSIRPIPPTYDSSSDFISSSSSMSMSSSEEVILNCPGSPPCGGELKGSCTAVGCKCIYPYIGDSCTSKTIIIDPPKTNTTSPSTSFDTNDTQEKTTYTGLISIYSIREYDGDHQLLKEYVFNEWIYTNVSTDSEIASNYTSSIINHDSSVTNISTTIRYFTKEETISFAGQQLEMYPSSIKYNVEISEYSFVSSLSYLQLIFGVSLASSSSSNTEECSSVSNGQVLGANDFFQVNINSYGLYGRFIKRAIIDSRKVSISNTKLNASDITQKRSSFDNVDSYIGINIPFFKQSALIDPDFSLIIDPSSAKDKQDSICNKQSSKLTTAQIAGIIVGCVAALSIGVATTIYFIKKKTFEKHSRDLEMKLNRL